MKNCIWTQKAILYKKCSTMDNLFFDLDGTIIDIQKRYYSLYSDCLSNLGGKPISQSKYWDLKRDNVSEEEILSITGNRSIHSDYRINRLQLIEAIPYLQMDQIWIDLKDQFIHLKNCFNLVLVTLRQNRASLDWQLDYLELRPFFSQIISSHDVQLDFLRHETKVKMVRKFFDERNLNGWFIGDTEVDILAGKALGLKTCAVGFGLRNQTLIQAHNPDHFVQTPGKLIEFLGDIESHQLSG
jgi:phosphoglycolate phosphatase